MDASVVIPALNEAELLPGLLSDLRRQRDVQHEVIVADAGSSDGTQELCRRLGARVVDGGLPAEGRNAGARVATGSVLVFLDADVRVKRDFLRSALTEMRERSLVAATCRARPLSNLSVDRVIHNFANAFIRLNQSTDPHAPGYCILITREVFEAIGGFDETLMVAEDHDLVSRATAHGPFRLLLRPTIQVSVRRYEKEGRVAYAIKSIQIAVHRAFRGEIGKGSDAIEYEFGDYSEDEVRGGRRVLREVERALLRIDRETAKLDDRVLLGNEQSGGAIDHLQRARDRFAEAWRQIAERSPEDDDEASRRPPRSAPER